MSKSHDEWYTPTNIVGIARSTMGMISLDPASCLQAQCTVDAEFAFGKLENGLKQDWWGGVWLNPPYCKDPDVYGDNLPGTHHWLSKAIAEYRSGKIEELVSIVNRSDGEWYYNLIPEFSSYYQCRKRVKFIDGKGESNSPRYNNDLLYLGPRPGRFWDACWSELGAPAPGSFERKTTGE
jgi:hypothetical protein